MKRLKVILICALLGILVCNNTSLEYINSLQKHQKFLQLCECVESYINKKSPKNQLSSQKLVLLCLKYDVDIAFVLAQGQIESMFGVVGIASKTNSVWNIGSYDNRSAEYINRTGRGYDHPNSSIEPYLKTLRNHYLVNGKTEQHLMNNFINTHGQRYATSTNYEPMLRSVYNRIVNTTSIRELQLSLNI